ncbi:FtsB family cell division protein [Aureimonas frigidaquae]|uniref:Septum formation initiator n=1 Tax=Aureimonas frigidaquae TaxID=424757 RepID=A0A0P0Z390_9HYPH|nr:septum formation initiator family protein [Aureimonas frigidaquae]BAT28424.1 septum formation initiator precursor [Aureimonas frigidaquae]
MRTRQKRKSRLGPFVVPVITMAVLAYFAMQSQEGRYGSDSKKEMAALLERREADLQRYTAERQALETRVRFLRDGSLERDMVDERARRALNMATEDEIVLLR